jgi:hypothetical protein
MTRKFLQTLFLLTCYTAVAAQQDRVDMADTMRANGKIYVVLAVVLTIFTGIILYLVRLDRKITKMEKTIHS